MLVKPSVVSQACPKGTNLAELAEVGQETYVKDGKTLSRPVFACVYLAGNPFEGRVFTLEAPADMQVGDVVRVTAGDFALLDVARRGKTIWQNEPISADERQRQAEKAEAQELRRKALR